METDGHHHDKVWSRGAEMRMTVWIWISRKILRNLHLPRCLCTTESDKQMLTRSHLCSRTRGNSGGGTRNVILGHLLRVTMRNYGKPLQSSSYSVPVRQRVRKDVENHAPLRSTSHCKNIFSTSNTRTQVRFVK